MAPTLTWLATLEQELPAILVVVLLVLIVLNSTRGLRRSICRKCGRAGAMKEHFRPGVAPPRPGWIEIVCIYCGYREWTLPEDTAG